MCACACVESSGELVGSFGGRYAPSRSSRSSRRRPAFARPTFITTKELENVIVFDLIACACACACPWPEPRGCLSAPRRLRPVEAVDREGGAPLLVLREMPPPPSPPRLRVSAWNPVGPFLLDLVRCEIVAIFSRFGVVYFFVTAGMVNTFE